VVLLLHLLLPHRAASTQQQDQGLGLGQQETASLLL